MSDWVIAIPSYHRSDSIKENTLKALDECNIPHNLIKVFVSKEEVPVYRASLPEDIEVIESVLGCIQNRAYIRDYYPEGQHIVFMDDDIKTIYSICDVTDDHATCHIFDKKNIGNSYYKKQMLIPNLHKFLTNAFVIMHKEGAHLGGFYPVCNGFFANHRYTTDLKYICGGFYLLRNVKDFQHQGDQYAEDWEASCAFYKRDGKVVRFDSVFVKTPYYKGVGGLVETRTVELSRIAQEKVAALYPDYVTVVPPTKNNKFWNLKIKKQKD